MKKYDLPAKWQKNRQTGFLVPHGVAPHSAANHKKSYAFVVVILYFFFQRKNNLNN